MEIERFSNTIKLFIFEKNKIWADKFNPHTTQ